MRELRRGLVSFFAFLFPSHFQGGPGGIRSTAELYEIVDSIIDDLDKAGEVEWRDRLNNAMLAGSVGDEIMGDIRIQLRQLEQTDIPKRLNLAETIDRVIVTIDWALKQT